MYHFEHDQHYADEYAWVEDNDLIEHILEAVNEG